MNDPCKECHLHYKLNPDDKKCLFRPYLTIQNCIKFDKVANECLECEDGYVLDSDESPFCAWNRKKSNADPNAETAVKYWSNPI